MSHNKFLPSSSELVKYRSAPPHPCTRHVYMHSAARSSSSNEGVVRRTQQVVPSVHGDEEGQPCGRDTAHHGGLFVVVVKLEGGGGREGERDDSSKRVICSDAASADQLVDGFIGWLVDW